MQTLCMNTVKYSVIPCEEMHNINLQYYTPVRPGSHRVSKALFTSAMMRFLICRTMDPNCT